MRQRQNAFHADYAKTANFFLRDPTCAIFAVFTIYAVYAHGHAHNFFQHMAKSVFEKDMSRFLKIKRCTKMHYICTTSPASAQEAFISFNGVSTCRFIFLFCHFKYHAVKQYIPCTLLLQKQISVVQRTNSSANRTQSFRRFLKLLLLPFSISLAQK